MTVTLPAWLAVAVAVLAAPRFVAQQVALMARSRWQRFGYACVNFGTPVSVREWAAARDVDFRRLAKEERFARIGELARADRDYAISAGLEMLQLRHVAEEADGLHTVRPEEARLVAYYANSIAHLLADANPAS